MTREGVRTDATVPLWSGTVVLRLVTFAFAVASVLIHQNGYARPTLAWLALGAMAGWTAFTVAAYWRAWGRTPWVIVADVLITCGLMYTSVLILSPAQMAEVAPLITTVWACEPPVAAAVLGGRAAGVTAGLVVAAQTALTRGEINTDVATDAVLLVGSGFVIGLASVTARRAQERMAQALRTEAATAERERLARSIHDSVLQVLARVRRRGAELGGDAAELARLAGEQEVALRSLVSAAPQESGPDGTTDLSARLRLLGAERVEVSTPATPVLLHAATVGELTSVVREALLNVDRHAGPDAKAWVLVEDLGAEVVITVRDDGAGIEPGRLARAEAEGRMGVARSIRGRVAQLGGTIDLQTASNEGTEWEMRIPRQPAGKKGRHKIGGA